MVLDDDCQRIVYQNLLRSAYELFSLGNFDEWNGNAFGRWRADFSMNKKQIKKKKCDEVENPHEEFY